MYYIMYKYNQTPGFYYSLLNTVTHLVKVHKVNCQSLAKKRQQVFKKTLFKKLKESTELEIHLTRIKIKTLIK